MLLEACKRDAPLPWQMNFQQPATPTMEGIIDLHHNIMFFMVFIVVFISYILIRAIYLFNDIRLETTHPVSNTTHFLLIEIIWTIIPLIVLFWIAIPSFSLLYSIDHCSKIELTMKVIGRQWYWTYEMDKFIPRIPETQKFIDNYSAYFPQIFSYWMDYWNFRLLTLQAIESRLTREGPFLYRNPKPLTDCTELIQKWLQFVSPQVFNLTFLKLTELAAVPIPEGTCPNIEGAIGWPSIIRQYAADPKHDNVVLFSMLRMSDREGITDQIPTQPKDWTIIDYIIISCMGVTRHNHVWLKFLWDTFNARFGKTHNIRPLIKINNRTWQLDFLEIFYRNKLNVGYTLGIDIGRKTVDHDHFEFDELGIYAWTMKSFYRDKLSALKDMWLIYVKARTLFRKYKFPLKPMNGSYDPYKKILADIIAKGKREHAIFVRDKNRLKHLLVDFDSCLVSDNDVYKNFLKAENLYYRDLTPSLSKIPTTFCGWWRLLEVDNRLVLPIKMKLRILVTSSDVIHSWAVPSLGVKIDACPGRLNCVYVYIKRPGFFHGQCSELCGVKHGFMPIVVHAVTKEKYNRWFAKNCDVIPFTK